MTLELFTYDTRTVNIISSASPPYFLNLDATTLAAEEVMLDGVPH